MIFLLSPALGGVRRSRRGVFSPSMGECGVAGGGCSPPAWGSAAQPEGGVLPQHGGVRRSRRGLTTRRVVSLREWTIDNKLAFVVGHSWQSRCINVSALHADYFFYLPGSSRSLSFAQDDTPSLKLRGADTTL